MQSRFYSKLVNGVFGDPVLLIQFYSQKRTILFDLGDLSSLSFRQLINVSDVFISHTHIDHFFGFDKLLRVSLGRNKQLNLYGPPGLFLNIEGKLSSYTWNMVKNYNQHLVFNVIEIYNKYIKTRKYKCSNKFKPGREKKYKIKNNVILLEKKFEICAAILDHGIKSIGFSIQEKPLIQIIPKELKAIGLVPGKWIKILKENILNQKKMKQLFSIVPKLNSQIKKIKTSFLIKKITKIYPGQKVTYITDVGYNEKNKKAIQKLAYQSKHLFIEAVFTSKHENLAKKKYHLTASQAGEIAHASKSKKLTIFHHSSRYLKNQNLLRIEAEKYFKGKQNL